MGAAAVLKDVRDFLRKDLAGEALSTRAKTKRTTLLSKVTECISNLEEQDKIDDFLVKQRDLSRPQPIDGERSKANGKVPSDEEEDNGYYMDLGEIQSTPGEDKLIIPPGVESYGSGSGYESYASDDETSARRKPSKEEDLSGYFLPSECDVFTYVYLENKNKFLKGKKWLKRVGVVKENHFKCYKKPSDSAAVLDIPLRAYNTTLKSREDTASILVVLSAPGVGESHKFSVERDDADEWSKVLREKTLSFTDGTDLPPPPVAARPLSTLQRPSLPQIPTNGAAQEATVQRSQSATVADGAKSTGGSSVFFVNSASLPPPPVPPRLPTTAQTSPQQFNYIGKGIKSAVTDMFKKDKTKKRMSAAETLGADVCGHLMVFDNKWVKKWCLVKRNQLLVYGKDERPDLQIELLGCVILPHSEDQERQFGFKLTRGGKEIVYMEASSSTEMGKWVGVLIAETGCGELPESEPEYMPMDIREAVYSTAKEAFQNRKEKAGQSTFYKDEADDDEEEDMYIDMTPANKLSPQAIEPPKIVPPPLPPSRGRPSITQSSLPDPTALTGSGKAQKTNKNPTVKPSDAVDSKAEKDKPSAGKRTKQKSTETREGKTDGVPAEGKKGKQKTSESGDEKGGDGKKAKHKDRKKGKQAKRLTLADITLPTDVVTTLDGDATEKDSSEMLSSKDAEVDGANKDQGKSMLESIVEKRRKELMGQKAEIKTKLHTLSVKKDTFNKYIQAATSEKESGRFRVMLQKVADEYSKLEKEDVSLELELRKLKDKLHGINSPSNKRPPSRRKRQSINTGAPGNVASRAKMFEVGSK